MSDRPHKIYEDAEPVQVTLWVRLSSDGYYDVYRYDGEGVGTATAESFPRHWGSDIPDPPFIDPLGLGLARKEIADLITARHIVRGPTRNLADWYAEKLGEDFK